MKTITLIVLCVVAMGMVCAHDLLAPNHVQHGWQFFPNGAVVPEDTYKVQVAKQQHWVAVRAHAGPQFGQPHF